MTQKLSKLLSYWLRHAPEAADLALDEAGWASVESVRAALAREGADPTLLEQVVADSDKQRFELSPDGTRVRARQGHSISVDLDWPIATPPETLYHGTVERFLEAIFAEGLKPMARHHVHLSPDVETAARVGERRGAPVLLRIAAGEMARHGTVFRLSTNGVWLVEAVPPAFLSRA
ncbi:RNA 2'-phosphotransferase [Sphingomonas sp. ABOLD]|uniref:RNA 2'-phosphotransferase n=1 Tax=unclassified Sphingomonas TaxID=196159 RepID=UPI000F7E1ED4|nr:MULTISPECIES: RNA 2'-phosphotransferase [unclassified Sphingomonas]RSV39641.1 RNA 2'-phosphotransferase [Sphingomonas sp. ABOLE]RSV47660.1 RNA 2'-phosphotransferase [Sphingomonas sp. ABOLD]